VSTFRVISETEIRERSYVRVATVRATRQELLDRGVELHTSVDDGTWDEAGPIQAAIVETSTGEQPLSIWHLSIDELPEHFNHAPPLELRAPSSTRDPQAFVHTFLPALALPDDRPEWIASAPEWAKLAG
jgi:hypothetical protein